MSMITGALALIWPSPRKCGMAVPGALRALLAQHARGELGPCFADVDLTVLDDRLRPRARARVVDLERADHEDVVAILVADVEPALEPDAGGKAKVGVVAAGGDEHDRRGADALCLRPSRRLRDLAAGVAPEASGLHRLGDRLEQRVVPLRARPPLPTALEVQPLLDLVAARVSDLVAQFAKLREVAAQRARGDAH